MTDAHFVCILHTHLCEKCASVISYMNTFLCRHIFVCLACVPHCNTLQHTATHCNTLQHTKILFACRTCMQEMTHLYVTRLYVTNLYMTHLHVTRLYVTHSYTTRVYANVGSVTFHPCPASSACPTVTTVTLRVYIPSL